jgi:hypothetical protein
MMRANRHLCVETISGKLKGNGKDREANHPSLGILCVYVNIFKKESSESVLTIKRTYL